MRKVNINGKVVGFPDDFTDDQIDEIVNRDFFGKSKGAAPDFNAQHRRTDGLPGDKVNFVEPTMMERYQGLTDSIIPGVMEGVAGAGALLADAAGFGGSDPGVVAAKMAERVGSSESLMPVTGLVTDGADKIQHKIRERREDQGYIRPGAITDTTDAVGRAVGNTLPDMMGALGVFEKPIEATADAAKNIYKYGYLTGEQALRKEGQVGEAIADELVDIHRTASQNANAAILDLQKANAKLSEAEWEQVRQLREGEIDASQVGQNVRDVEARIKSQLDDIATAAENNKMVVWDKELGQAVPFQRRENYFPRMREAEDFPIFTQTNDPALGQRLQNLRQRRVSETNDNYIKDPRVALTEYFKKAYRDIEEGTRFGGDLNVAMNQRIQQAVQAGEDGELIREVLQKELGHGGYLSQSEEGVARLMTTYQAATKMPFSVIGNLNQFATTAANAGLVRTAKAAMKTGMNMAKWKITGNLAEDTDLALRSGAALESVSRYILPSNADGALAKIANGQLWPFRKSETWLRVSAAAAGQEFAQDLAKVALGKGGVSWVDRMIPNLKRLATNMPVFKAQTQAIEQLRKMGVNTENLRQLGKLTDEDLKNAGFYMSHHTQYGARAMDLPVWWSSTHNPWKRVMLQFKGVGLRMWHTVADDIVKPAAKGDLRPAINYAAASAGIGAGGQMLLDAIKSEDSKDAKEYLINGALANVTNNFVVQTIKDIYTGGGMGAVRSVVGVSGRTLENVANFATGRQKPAQFAAKESSLFSKVSQNIKNQKDRADAEKAFRAINDLPDGEVLAAVEQIVDGDTMDAKMPNGNTERLRLLNVDAPEHDQPRGGESIEGLRQLVGGKQISLNPKARDAYGRMIVEALVDGKSVNLEQVKKGLAWHSSDIARDQELMQRIKYSLAQVYAKLAKRGVWADAKPEEPAKFRARTKREE